MINALNKGVKYITDKFPGPFLNYMRNQLKTSELKNSSLYEITKVAFETTNLDDLYKSIHENISKFMYAENFYIALYKQDKNIITFPYCQDTRSASLHCTVNCSSILKLLWNLTYLLMK